VREGGGRRRRFGEVVGCEEGEELELVEKLDAEAKGDQPAFDESRITMLITGVERQFSSVGRE